MDHLYFFALGPTGGGSVTGNYDSFLACVSVGSSESAVGPADNSHVSAAYNYSVAVSISD